MITPPPLKIGDKIGITATARKITHAEIAPAIALIEHWGLGAVVGQTIGTEHHQFAADDQARADDLSRFLKDETIKAVWCARGGYGTFRMVDKVDWHPLKKHPKWIIGYSDLTVLHSHLAHCLHLKSMHATMPINVLNNTPQALDSLKSALFGQIPQYAWQPTPLNRSGQATGRLIGGNLSVLYSITASPTEANWQNKILFLEDLDEYLYHIDRMMLNLRRRGILAKLAGLVVGGMIDMHDNNVPFGKTAYEIIADYVADYHYPLAFDFPAGHISDNRTLIMGQTVRLNVAPNSAQLDPINDT